DRLGDVAGLDLLYELPLLVLDARDRAIPGADRAVDAPVGMDDVFLVLVARDRVRGALDLADPAADARFGDEMRHRLPPAVEAPPRRTCEKYHKRRERPLRERNVLPGLPLEVNGDRKP